MNPAPSYVQERIAGYGKPRKIVPGEYHVTDLFDKPATQLVQLYRQLVGPKGIDAWLSGRGRGVEGVFTAGAKDGYADALMRLDVELPDGDVVVLEGHPDELRWLGPKDAEIIEIVSDLDDQNPAKHRKKLEQATAYYWMKQMGAKLYREEWSGGRRYEGTRTLHEIDMPENIVGLRVVFGGWYAPGEFFHHPSPQLAAQVSEFLLSKIAIVHGLAVKLDEPVEYAIDFDLRHGLPDRTSEVLAAPDIEAAAQKDKKIAHAIDVLEGKRSVLRRRILVALQERGLDAVKSAWGTLKRMQRSSGIVEHDAALINFLRERGARPEDFATTKTVQVTERDDTALDAFLQSHGKTLADFQEEALGEPYTQLWANKACKEALEDLDVASFVRNLLDEQPE